MDKKPEIILLGAGGHCRSCIDVVESEGRFTVAGIVDRIDGGGSSSVLGCVYMLKTNICNSKESSCKEVWSYSLTTTFKSVSFNA